MERLERLVSPLLSLVMSVRAHSIDGFDLVLSGVRKCSPLQPLPIFFTLASFYFPRISRVCTFRFYSLYPAVFPRMYVLFTQLIQSDLLVITKP